MNEIERAQKKFERIAAAAAAANERAEKVVRRTERKIARRTRAAQIRAVENERDRA